MSSDCLTIARESTYGRDINSIGLSNDSIYLQEYQHRHSNHESLFNNTEFYDVKLVASGKELYARNKAFLAAHIRPVFLANSNMKEKQENRVELVDVDYEVLEELLRFIYSGKIKNIETKAYDLLAVVDMYAVGGLKNICKKYLSRNLSKDNVINALSFDDL